VREVAPVAILVSEGPPTLGIVIVIRCLKSIYSCLIFPFVISIRVLIKLLSHSVSTVFRPISRCIATGWPRRTVCLYHSGIQLTIRNGPSTIRHFLRGSNTSWLKLLPLLILTCYRYTIVITRQMPPYSFSDSASSLLILFFITDLGSKYYSNCITIYIYIIHLYV